MDEYSKQFEISGAEEILEYLPNDIVAILSDLGLDIKNQKFDLDIDNLFGSIFEYITSSITSPLSIFGVILAVLAICSLFLTLTTGERQREIISYVSSVILCGGIIFPIFDLLSKSVTTISLCCGFNMTLIPIYSGILLAAGSVKSLATVNLLFVISQGVEIFISVIFTSLVGIYTSLSMSSSLNIFGGFSGFTTSTKKIIDWVLGLTVTLYLSVLTVTGIISSVSDTIVQRIGKFAVNSTIPIVGGVISESFGTILGALKYLKSGVGVYVLCALVLILLPIIIETLIWRFVLMISSFVADALEQSTASFLLKSISNGVGIILSVVASVSIVFVVSVVAVIMGGSGI